MNVLILYDSVFGNTEKIARAIGNSINAGNKVETLHIKDFRPEHLTGLEVLIVGSPTQKFSPLATFNEFIGKIPSNGFKRIKVAAFDTRISADDTNSRFLKMMIRLFGYAASPILKKLESRGGTRIIPPEGFFVNDTKGPLKEEEIERAAEWGRLIVNSL